MTNDQKKFLKVQLAEAYRLRQSRLPKRWPSAHQKPAEVRKVEKQIKALKKTVSRWEGGIKAAHEAADKKLRAEYSKAHEALLFADPQVALKAVKTFAARS